MNINDLLKEYENKLVVLVDLSWILYRSYYAFKDLANQQGQPTGQYYGLTNLIKRINTSYPDCLILLVDDGNPVERKQLNESYKGNREHSVHFADKHRIIDLLIGPVTNCYRVHHPTLEADDLLYSISRIKDFNNQFIIHTADKDLLQAIDETTYWSKEFKQGAFTKVTNESDYYVDNFKDLLPFQLPYYRAVLGDPSDNLPIIRPRFPSKVAYYFAKHNIYKSPEGNLIIKKLNEVPKDDLTETQFNQLTEIYKSEQFINNLKIMKLDKQNNIPIIDKDFLMQDSLKLMNDLELKQYHQWVYREYV